MGQYGRPPLATAGLLVNVATISVFSSVNKTSLDENFSTTLSTGWVLHRSSLHLALEYGYFQAQRWMAMHLRCGGKSSYCFVTFIRNLQLSLLAKSLKTDKVRTKVLYSGLFFRTWYSSKSVVPLYHHQHEHITWQVTTNSLKCIKC